METTLTPVPPETSAQPAATSPHAPSANPHTMNTDRTINGDTMLAAQDLRFGYDRNTAVVDGVSVELRPGRLGALIGPNAAGKSTLLRLLLGQLEPWSGSVVIEGHCVTQMPPARRARWISYVPQRGSGSFAFTVEHVVSLGRYALGPDPQAVEHALATCGLTDLRHHVHAHLSVGQQQRVLLARAIAQATGHGRVMLLDEPGSAMDLWHIHQMMHTLRQLARSGLAVLVVLHDPNLAARYVDDAWLMDHGRIVAAGPWRSVLTGDILEPVYRMKFNTLSPPDHDRPVFDVEPQDTPSDTLVGRS